MPPWSAELAGTLNEHVIDSELLRDNPLGDPYERPLWVYVPPGYADASARRYPSVYVIQGYTGQVTAWRNRSPFRRPFPETADEAFASGAAPPAIVVYVDAWTAYGGSQFVDSPGTGNYHSYLCDEVVPWVDARYRTMADRDHRAIMGKSSGGFGAMITPMLRPDLFGGLATHAGDSLYEYCYLRDFGSAVRALRGYDGDIWRWWDDFGSRVSFTKQEDMLLIGLIGVAAAFSARADGTVDLPFDPHTGVIDQAVWQRWLDWDPVRMAAGHADALRSLHSIWIDAGTSDDYFLDLGAEAFRAELRRIGVAEDVVRYELFDATHSAIDYGTPRLSPGSASACPASWRERSGAWLRSHGLGRTQVPRSEMRMQNRWWAVPVLAGAAAVITACGTSTPSSPGAAPSTTTPAASAPASSPATTGSGAVISTRSTGLGMVLTNAQGHTLYWFAKDTATASNCNGSCATYWPPVHGTAAGTSLPKAFSTITRSDGTTQATYAGHPLYTYAADTSAGMTSGNGQNLSGGLWWAMTPSGAKPGGTPSPSSTSSGGGGYGY